MIQRGRDRARLAVKMLWHGFRMQPLRIISGLPKRSISHDFPLTIFHAKETYTQQTDTCQGLKSLKTIMGSRLIKSDAKKR